VIKAPDLGRIRDLAAPNAELRSSAAANSFAVLVPSLNSLIEFRNDR
jgi:hypothetical protein